MCHGHCILPMEKYSAKLFIPTNMSVPHTHTQHKHLIIYCSTVYRRLCKRTGHTGVKFYKNRCLWVFVCIIMCICQWYDHLYCHSHWWCSVCVWVCGCVWVCVCVLCCPGAGELRGCLCFVCVWVTTMLCSLVLSFVICNHGGWELLVARVCREYAARKAQLFRFL